MDVARVLEHVQYAILPHLTDLDKLHFNATCKGLYNPCVIKALVFDDTIRLAYQLACESHHKQSRTLVYTNDLGEKEKRHVNICIGLNMITIRCVVWSHKEYQTMTHNICTIDKRILDIFQQVYKALSTV